MRCVICAAVAAVIALAALTGCQQSDPETKALIKAMAEKQQESSTTTTATAEVDTSKLEKRIEELSEQIRAMKFAAEEQATKTQTKVEAVNTTFSNEVNALKTSISEAKSAAVDASNDVRTVRNDVTSITAKTSRMAETMDGIQTTLKLIDPKEMIKLSQQLGEKEGKLIKLQNLNNELQNTIDNLAKDREDTKQTMATLEAEIEKLKAGSIGGHPDYKEMKSQMREWRTKFEQLDADYQKMQEYAKALRKACEEAKIEIESIEPARETAEVAGNPTSTEKGGGESNKPLSKEEPFLAQIADDPTFLKENKEFIFFASLKKGEMPEQGEILWVVDLEGNFLCEVQVITLYEDSKEFGAQTMNIGENRSPIRGDKLVLPRANGEKQARSGD